MSRKPLLLLPLLAIAAGLLYWQSQASNSAGDGQSILYGNVEIREAQLALNSSEHLASAELSAPRNGIIRDRLAVPGEFVTPAEPGAAG